MSMFEGRHYEYIADMLVKQIQSEQYRNDIAIELAAIFAADNRNFKKGRFFTRCGVNEWQVRQSIVP